MVNDYSNVTNNLMSISRQLAETVERSKQTVGSLEVGDQAFNLSKKQNFVKLNIFYDQSQARVGDRIFLNRKVDQYNNTIMIFNLGVKPVC